MRAHDDAMELILFNAAINRLACVPNNTHLREFYEHVWRDADAGFKRRFIVDMREHPENYPEIIAEVTKIRMKL